MRLLILCLSYYKWSQFFCSRIWSSYLVQFSWSFTSKGKHSDAGLRGQMHKGTEHAPAVLWSLLAKERLLSRSLVLCFILWKLCLYAKKDLLLRSLTILFYNWISCSEPSSDFPGNVISIVCISPVSLFFCHLFLPHSVSYKSSECLFFFCISLLQRHSLLEFIIELTSP